METSLQVASLLAITSSLNVPETLELLADNSVYEMVLRDSDFIKAKLLSLGHQQLITQRSDLQSPEQWLALAEAFDTWVEYYCEFKHGEEELEPVILTMESQLSPNWIRQHHNTTLLVRGLPLMIGMKVWVAFTMHNRIQQVDFFPTIQLCTKWLIDKLVKHFLRYPTHRFSDLEFEDDVPLLDRLKSQAEHLIEMVTYNRHNLCLQHSEPHAEEYVELFLGYAHFTVQ